MSTERFRPYVSVQLMLVKDGQTLLARRYNTGYQDGNYGLAAGHIDGNEPITVAVAREAKEETGITVEPSDLRVFLTMHRQSTSEREYLDFFLTTDIWQGEPRVMEHDKCDQVGWFPLDDLPDNTIDYIKEAVLCYKKGQNYLEFGW